MRGLPYQACIPSIYYPAGFAQECEFKSFGKTDALKFGTRPGQDARTAAVENLDRQVTTDFAGQFCGAQLPRRANDRV